MPRLKKEKIVIYCLVCGKECEISPWLFGKRKFCSLSCSTKSTAEYIKKECPQCAKSFTVSLTNRHQVFCSDECYKNSWEKVELQCKKCDKLFVRKKWENRTSNKNNYCSRECYNNREDDIYVNCSGCDKLFQIFPSRKKYYNRYYCGRQCLIKFGPIGKLTDEIFDNNYQKFIRKVRHCAKYYDWRNLVLNRDGHRCVNCDTHDKITVHHKYVSMYDFVKKHNFDIEHIYADPLFFDIKNGETLCRSCHAKEHRKS